MNSGIALAWHTQKREEDKDPHLSACVCHTVRGFHISQVHIQKLVSLPGHRCCWQAAACSCWPRGWRLQQHEAEPASAYGKGQLPHWGYLLHYPDLWARQSQHPWAIIVCCLPLLWLKVTESQSQSHGKRKHTLKRGRNIPVVAELRLSWFISMSFSLSHEFSCICVYMQELIQGKRFLSKGYS